MASLSKYDNLDVNISDKGENEMYYDRRYDLYFAKHGVAAISQRGQYFLESFSEEFTAKQIYQRVQGGRFDLRISFQNVQVRDSLAA